MPELTILHWIYLLVVLWVVGSMIFRRDVVVPCIVGIFLIGWVFAEYQLVGAAQTVFRALETAGTELFDIMLVIALMVSMLKALQSIGSDVLMVAPAKRFMTKPTVAFITLAAVMYIAATFFWPTPAVALVGTILIPVAISAGLAPMAAAMALNLAGHGMALSGDVVLQGAPAITARAADVDVALIFTTAWMFALITGLIALTVAYFTLRRRGELEASPDEAKKNELLKASGEIKPTGVSKFFAAAVPAIFFLIIIVMIRSNLNPDLPDIKGGGATSLLGGTAAFFLLAVSLGGHGSAALEKVVGFLREGFLFSIKIFAAVIPIAGFFFLGAPGLAPAILGEGAPGFMFDLGTALANVLPLGTVPLAFGIVLVGIMTGLDGSGFSGLPLVGSLANALGGPAGVDVATLAALGQVAAIWTGGGTLTAWAFGVVADAGIAGVSPIELVRRNFACVGAGLFVTTLVAIMIM
ncbi:hypothetical protein F9B85_12405 [Heliorestis acidaminivorans]|uniref:Transporter n=1 Tax=Heliorestis acidaminivorans TaxID=553427 RepID=A0A6I0EPY7_9FIRM|nr:hypothetical protein [Heliorestis acidaminivorans]KAB2951376.1 hypothetical protein F9B85_12405 [Heliorestis acidaminivorans]